MDADGVFLVLLLYGIVLFIRLVAGRNHVLEAWSG